MITIIIAWLIISPIAAFIIGPCIAFGMGDIPASERDARRIAGKG